MFVKITYLFFLLFTLNSCASLSENAEDVILNGSILQDNLIIKDIDSLPKNMWSPEQRKLNAAVYFLIAQTLDLRQEHNSKSLEFFEAAYALDADPYIGAKTIIGKARAGKKGEALSQAHRLSLLYPLNNQLRFLYANLLFDIKQYAKAKIEFERVVELDRNHEQAYMKLVAIAELEGRSSADILSIVNEMAKYSPNSVFALSYIARIHLKNKLYKKALAPAKKAFELQSKNIILIQMYAIIAQLNGENKIAKRLWERLYLLNPNDDSTAQHIVDLYKQLGNLDEALELINEIISTSKEDRTLFRIQKVIILWEMKKDKLAQKELEYLYKKNKSVERIQYMTGIGRIRVGDFKGALSVLEQVSELSKIGYACTFQIMEIYKNTNDIPKALSFKKRLLESPYLDSEAYKYIARLYSLQKDHKTAITFLKDGYKRYPNKLDLLFSTGVYYEKAGDIVNSRLAMRRVIKKDSKNSAALNYLGYLYAEKGENLDEALTLIKKAVKLKPNDGYYLDSLGWVYFKKGDFKKAYIYLKQAYKKEPQEAIIIDHLADVYKKLNKKAKAIKFYKLALSLTKTKQDRAKIKVKLKELEQ